MKSSLKKITFFLLILSFLLFFRFTVYANSIEENMESTVLITVGDLNRGFVIGSGFVISDYHVVTNYHVIMDYEIGEPVQIFLSENEIIPVTVIWQSTDKDLAVIEAETSLNLPIVRFSLSDDVKVADQVYVMGFPGAATGDGLIDPSDLSTVKVAQGIISAKVKSSFGVNLYQTDAPINPGNSGGPLFSSWGTVIGINTYASLVQGVILDENGEPTTDRIRLGDNIGWSVQVDELLVELDALSIPYQLVERPDTTSKNSPLDLNTLLITLVIIAVILGVTSIILATTKRGKVVVEEVSRRIISQNPKKIIPQSQIAKKSSWKPYLIALTGPYQGKKFPLEKTIKIGRNPNGNHLVIPTNDISGYHCEISYDSNLSKFVIVDLGSTNGTYFENGHKIQANKKTFLFPSHKFYLSNENHLFEVRLEA